MDKFNNYERLRFVRWHENSVDVVPHNGSKAATILHLAEQVGIAKEDVISFGDGQNDREMLTNVWNRCGNGKCCAQKFNKKQM
jgi:hydroxymethylpyrimidine pyrophosphatase-like HAD family hydrolase